ncbi:MAG TPA: hypothetical protein VLE91_04765 [Candidatus Saccharimonadales bacterium]|nr:hypothetical protein [Candidatus Saccharimonadales bacterium]
MKPHALAHSVAGLGVGFILVHFVPTLVPNALMIGVVVLVAGIVFDLMVNK